MKMFLSVLWRLVRWAIFSVGFVTVTLIVILIGATALKEPGRQLADQNYLKVTWSGEIGETPKFAGLSVFTGRAPLSVSNVINLIDRARDDNRIQALVMDMSGIDLSFAQAEEFAPAITRFRATGKKAYAYSQSYNLSRYRLAVMFDQVWLLGSGTFDGSGPYFEIPFARPLLDTLGIQPQFEKRKDFKNAMDSALETTMPSPMREAMTQLGRDIDDQALAAISKARRIPLTDLPARLRSSLLNPGAALENGLIDRLAYPADIDRMLDIPAVTLKQFAAADSSLTDTEMFSTGAGPGRVALITASGAITSGPASGSLSQDGISGGRLAAKIHAAARDDTIAGIVLRIDSPGGEYGASDLVRNALQRADKPVIVSMGSVAGSGGYLIAIGGDRIVAQPSTLTGSIGVIGGKFAAQRAFEQIGVNWESIRTRTDPGLRSLKPFNESQRAVFAGSIDRIYNEFVAAVAMARNLTAEQAERAAQGRIWSGTRALDLGLVDRLGGLTEARAEMAALLKLDPDHITLAPYPAHNSFQQVLNLLADTPAIMTEVGNLTRAAENLRNHPGTKVLSRAVMQQPGSATMIMPVIR